MTEHGADGMNAMKQTVCLLADACSAVGMATGLRLAGEGARLALCCPDGEQPDPAFLEQLDGMETPYRIEQADFGNSESLDALVGRIESDARLGGIHAMFYNLVPPVVRQHINGMSLAQIDGLIDTWITRAFLAAKVIGGAMARQKSGSMVFLASLHDDKPNGIAPLTSMYMGALKNMSREAALFFGADGVRCNLIEPGAMGGEDALYRGGLSTFYEGYPFKIPGGYVGGAQDAAALAIFLLSGESKYLNGAEIRMDGGLLLHYIDTFANRQALKQAGRDIYGAKR